MKSLLHSLSRLGNIFTQRLLPLLFLMTLCMSSLHAQIGEVEYKSREFGHLVECNVGIVNDDRAIFILQVVQNPKKDAAPALAFRLADVQNDKLESYHQQLDKSAKKQMEIGIKIVLSNGEIISSERCGYANTSHLIEELVMSFKSLVSNKKNTQRDTWAYDSYIATQLSTYDIKSIEVFGTKYNFIKVKTAKVYKQLFDLLASKTKLLWYPANSTTSNNSSSSSYNPPVSEYPLTLNGSTSCRLSVSGSGNGDAGDAISVRTRTGKIVSDAGLPDYKVTSDSYWARIALQSDAAFLLYVDPNNSGAPRTANITVSVNGHSTSMTVYQPCNYITINNVWVEFDKWQNMQKGMKIHTSFNVNGVRGQQGEISAYFYFQNGTRLNDYNNNYRTMDGQVSTWGRFVPSYDATTYNDYELFIPYNELHVNGAADLKFFIEVRIGGQHQQSSHYNFTVR